LIRDDGHWLALTDKFHQAALDGTGWYAALQGLAAATGSSHGELICVGKDAAVPLHILTDSDPALLDDFMELRGGDPNVNPRVKAGMEAPVLKVLAESDFLTVDEHRRHAHYDEFARPWNIPYICLTTLDREPGLLTGLATPRSEKDGHITAEQRRAFETIAPHVRAAVRTHVALEGHGDALLAGALEALSMPAFICDRTGYVRKMTPAAEALVSRGRGLQLKLRQLTATLPADSQSLSDAIHAAALPRDKVGAPLDRSIVVREREGDMTPLVVDVIALPNHRFQLNFLPRVLVLIRGASPETSARRRKVILQTVFGLTPAETDIALQLHAGKSPEAIAASRNVSLATVRSQIKALLAKSGASRQAELVARMSQL
jgi:DNA-binding CsgD family transcriptional regulator